MNRAKLGLLLIAVVSGGLADGVAAGVRQPTSITGLLTGVQSLASAATPSGAPDAAALAAGKHTFSQNCAACHGAKGTGGPAPEGGKAPRDLSQPAFQDARTDAQLYAVVHDGVPPDFYMEAWGDRLSDTEIRNVIAYLRTLRAPSKTAPAGK